MKPMFFSGLDLGLTQQFTALAVLECTEAADPQASQRRVKHYAVRHLERFLLGTPYTEVAARVSTLFGVPPLQRSSLAVDLTAVGPPVMRLLSRARVQARLRAVFVTGGQEAQLDEMSGWRVPKTNLVSTLQILLQSRRLKVASDLPEAQTLVQELQTFQLKVTVSAAAALTPEAWRDRPHDDLVLAVAIAAWEGENLRTFCVA
jgi:hypothetical protein